MKEKSTKVTVLMPAYNAEKYIADAIKSVLQQSYSDFRLLIVDDGSSDQTQKIIHSFSDKRIQLIYQSHQGIAVALNKGLAESDSMYIARFDADDICLPNRLERQVDFLDHQPDYVIVGSDAEYISENAEHLFNFYCTGYSNEEIREKIHQDCPFIHSAVMYRRDAVEKAGGYSVHAHNFEDYLLWMQLMKLGKFHNLSQQLIKVRFNPSSVTIDERWRGRNFRKLKRRIIQKGSITEKEGSYLLARINSQNTDQIKEGAYHALCGKKFLLDNQLPKKARIHFSKAISIYPYRLDNYAFFILSFFPRSFIHWLYQVKAKKMQHL